MSPFESFDLCSLDSLEMLVDTMIQFCYVANGLNFRVNYC